VQAVDTWTRYAAKKNRGFTSDVERKMCEAHAANATGTGAEKYAALAAEFKNDAQRQKDGLKTVYDEAKGWEKGSADSHHRSAFFDLGELGLELGLVLCSVAVLSKRRGYFYAGILTAVLGLGSAAFGYAFIHPQEPAHPAESTETGSGVEAGAPSG